MSYPSWPRCPFTAGHRYRVRRSFDCLRDSFTEGEVLVFDRCAWSRYDGITGYFFHNEGTTNGRAWDLPDEEDVSVWPELFEALPEQTVG